MIKALLLDLDGTLLDDGTAMTAACDAFCQTHRNYLKDRSLDDFSTHWGELSSRHGRRYVSGELDFDGWPKHGSRILRPATLGIAGAGNVIGLSNRRCGAPA